MLHNVLIGVHAGLGVLAFAAGVSAIPHDRFITVFVWAVVGTIAFLVAALAVEWTALDTTEQVIFAALAVLGGYMVVRAAQATKARPTPTCGPTPEYVDHVGFDVIALFDAFVIILVLDLGGPIWLMVTAGIVIAIVGHFAVRGLKHRLVPASAPPPVL